MYDLDAMVDVDEANQSLASYDITIGLSLEQSGIVEEMMAEQRRQTIKPVVSSVNTETLALLSTKIYQNAFNFLSGYASSSGQVPLKALESWWNKFKSKVQNDPKFLDNTD